MAIKKKKGNAVYWRLVRIKAKQLKSDGCSGVPDFYRDC
jgi:hypothetical protein